MNPSIVTLPTFTDERGILTVMEKEPFDIKRVFWLYDLKDKRGGHAHKECHQLIVAVHGSIEVEIDGQEYWLFNPSIGLHVPPRHFVNISGTGVALILCSDHYDEDDYIR